MAIKDLFQSKFIRRLSLAAGGIIAALLIFQLGVYVGSRKADFSFRWADNYQRNFGGPPNGFLSDFTSGGFLSGHGVAGQVVKTDGDDLVIVGQDNVEKIVQLSSSTPIRKGAAGISASQIQPNEQVVIIGVPQDDGTVQARIVRVFDAPAAAQ